MREIIMEEAKEKVEMAGQIVRDRLAEYSDLGDRPPSPPAWLLRVDDLLKQAGSIMGNHIHE
jgi:hypothetical protein